MSTYRITKQVETRDEKIRLVVRIEVPDQKYPSCWSIERTLVVHVSPPSWIARKIFKISYEEKCLEEMEILVREAREYVDKKRTTDRIANVILEKYPNE